MGLPGTAARTMALIRHEVVVTRGTALCLSFGILLAVACGDSVPGTGGTGGAAGSGGSAGSPDPCGEDNESIDLACQALSESECELSEECEPVHGSLWQPGMDAADCLAQPREFVSCGGCLRGYHAPSCTYHPSNPEACYCMPAAILLTGWEDVFECQVPEGICGT